MAIAQEQSAKKDETKEDDDEHNDPQSGSGRVDTENGAENAATEKHQGNQGILILDATCIPADIKYPTDLGLLNEAREKLEKIIDTFHSANGKQGKKPRTYRQKARKAYLSISKQRSPRKVQLRQGIKRQLQYCKRNLRHVDQLLTEGSSGMDVLSRGQALLLKTIRTVIAQQEKMYKEKNHRIADRIVNLYQPHVRPIVRGKAGAAVEFGAKVAVSIENGICRIEKLSWDAYNEACTLIESVERYNRRRSAREAAKPSPRPQAGLTDSLDSLILMEGVKHKQLLMLTSNFPNPAGFRRKLFRNRRQTLAKSPAGTTG